MGLPEGVFILSNIGEAPGQPTYFEPVFSESERAEQWKRIVLRGCSDRLCSVFKTEEEAMVYLNSSNTPLPKPPRRPGPMLKE